MRRTCIDLGLLIVKTQVPSWFLLPVVRTLEWTSNRVFFFSGSAGGTRRYGDHADPAVAYMYFTDTSDWVRLRSDVGSITRIVFVSGDE